MEIAEYDASGTLLRRFVPGTGTDDRVVLIEVGSGCGDSASSCSETSRTYYVADRIGHVIATFDASGDLIDSYRYTPFGVHDDGTPQAGQPFRYTGRRLDPETGLYLYRARYYDQEHGRFLETDPVGYKDQMNLYAYCRNDPVGCTDPTGAAGLISGGYALADTRDLVLAYFGDSSAKRRYVNRLKSRIVFASISMSFGTGAAFELAVSTASARGVLAALGLDLANSVATGASLNALEGNSMLAGAGTSVVGSRIGNNVGVRLKVLAMLVPGSRLTASIFQRGLKAAGNIVPPFASNAATDFLDGDDAATTNQSVTQGTAGTATADAFSEDQEETSFQGITIVHCSGRMDCAD